MQALNEANINPQPDFERKLAEERKKTAELARRLDNQYAKLTRLRKTYQDHLKHVEEEHSRVSQTNQQLWEEKKALEEANNSKEAQILVLTDQIGALKTELESAKSDASYFEQLISDRDRVLGELKAELTTIKAKICHLIQ